MKYVIPATLLITAGNALAAVPGEVTSILTDIGLVNTAVATVAAVVIITWMAFRLAKRAIK